MVHGRIAQVLHASYRPFRRSNSNPVDLVGGGATYTPTATATSGLTVTFTIDASSSSICTLSAGVVSFAASGTCRINADQPGNAGYAAAPQVQQSFTVSAASQTIGFTSTAPVAAIVGGATYTPVATATSGLTVAFTIDPASNGICGIAAGIVSFTSAGTCRINADQPGDASYAAAPQVQQSFTVSAASQTIGFTSTAPVAAIVGGATYTPVAAATSGLTVAFTIDPASNGICGIAAGVVSFTGAGTCRIDADQPGDASYAAAPQVQQSFTVSAATGAVEVTTSAPGAARVGGAPYTPAATATSGLPVDLTISPASSAICTLSGGNVTFGAAGTCVIDANQAGNTGYAAASLVQQSVTVAKGDQTVDFAGLSNASLSASPLTLSATAQSGLTVQFASSTTGICTVAGTTLSLITQGTCTVTADQPGDTNWDPAPTVTRSFTVLPVTLTLSSLPAASAVVGATFSQDNTVTGGVAPYHFTLASGALPAGTSLNAATGAVRGTLTSAGAFSYAVTVADAASTPTTATGSTISGTVAKGSQTVGFTSTPPAPAIVGGTYTVAAQSSVTLSPVYTIASASAGQCAATGATVTFTAAGSCVILADQAGSDDYDAAPQISQSVTVLAAPTAADRTETIAYDSTGTAIDLTASIGGGAHDSVAIVTAPAHGVAGVVGSIVTYTPTAGYFGADSFTYSVTGAGGTSAPATVSLTIATPAAPGAVGSTVDIAYDSAGQAIALQPSGVYTSVAVATAPTKGTVTLSGTTATYIPTPGSFGADSFTYTATGPGGTSAPATISVTIATPATPGAAGSAVDVAYDSAGQAIPLQPSGVYTSVVVATAPTKGTVTLNGVTATYVPTPGSFGADSFTYTATGPGGTSAPATISVTIATPATPGVTGSAVDVAYDSAGQAIPLQPSGVYTTVAVATGPTKGTVTLSGTTATYVPTPGNFGADSFTYTATGPGGTSPPATISVTIATPATPGAAGSAVDVAYDSAGQAIPLQPSGVYTSVAVATAPTKGTVTLSGTTATYVPTPGNFGADSFTYTATGPGGTSAPATISVTIATPATPGVTGSAVDVAYDSAGQAIPLQPSGVYTSLVVATAPTKGTVTLNGVTATYVPTPGSFGADSFTYTATGPGGTSAPATVSITIATPATPGAAGVSADVAFDSAEQPIVLQPTGIYTSVELATEPTKGSVTLSGTTARYVPTPGSFGADSFTYVATGPGGRSPAATVSVTIAAPPVPVAEPINVDTAGTTVEGGASVGIDLGRLVSGTFATIEIATPPANGTVTLRGTAAAARSTGGARALAVSDWTATYEPNPGYAGKDSFQFVAVGPGGRSLPATVEITVTGQAPTAQAKSASIGDAQTVSVELTEGAIGGPFTGATIVAVSPAEAATARIVQGGTAAQPSYRLDVTTAAHFGGTVVVRYRLGNAFGLSAPATVTITVTARPDPSADPVVRAISDAQAETARRFARTQVSNFMARAQQLHHGGGATNPLGIAVNLRDAVLTPDPRVSGRDPALSSDGLDRTGFVSRSVAEATLPGRMIGSGRGNDLPERDGAPRSDAATVGPRPVGDIALWTGGSIEVGTLDRRSGRAKITLASGGLSTGADLRIADWATIGLGGGYGSDVSRIDGEAARIRSETKVFAAYGSFAPVDGTFVDAMIGHGSLDYRTRRAVAATGGVALGKREGGMTFGAVSAGVDRQNDGLRWSGYGRLEWLDGTLDGYSETGVARYALRFDDRSVRSLTGVVGGRFEIAHDLGFAQVSPRIAAEWLHEFQTAGVQSLDYADFSGLATYRIRGTGWQREQYQLSVGSRWSLMLQWMVDMEIGLRGAAGESAAQGRLRISKRF
jgi:uncharacterized protein YhjY with autotransporter beta-barrel domain